MPELDKEVVQVDLATMDTKALEALQKRIAERMAQEKAKGLEALRAEYVALIARIDAACAPYGLTARKLLSSTTQQVEDIVARAAGQEAPENPRRKRSAVPRKYRNPENHAQTWTGRGHQPAWVTDWLDKRGGKLQDLLIRE